MSTQDIRRKINWMSREAIVKLLESYGIACYDTESTEDLEQALFENVYDGTISEDELE